MYDMEFDAQNGTVRLRLTGLWTAETMTRFHEALLALTRRLERSHPTFVILSDCRTYPVQSSDVMLGWSRLLGAGRNLVHRPYAIVVGSTLNKLQAQRALDAPNITVFTDMDHAEEWLSTHRR